MLKSLPKDRIRYFENKLRQASHGPKLNNHVLSIVFYSLHEKRYDVSFYEKILLNTPTQKEKQEPNSESSLNQQTPSLNLGNLESVLTSSHEQEILSSREKISHLRIR